MKLEKRQFKDQLDKIQFNELSKSKKIQSLSKECDVLKDQLERSEGDLKLAEKHVDLLKHKNAKLVSKLKKVSQASLKDKKDLDSSSFTDLLNESNKMQAFSASTPKLSNPSGSSQKGSLDSSFDLFSSPSPVKENANPEVVQECSFDSQMPSSSARPTCSGSKRPLEEDSSEDDPTTKYFKITSASQSNSQKMKKFKSDSAVKESNAILKYANMNIFKKKELGERHKNFGSIVQKGFDGLGGHTTHINSLGNPFKVPGNKRTQTKTKKTPSLPKLDNFIVID